jgi:flagellar basal-body rod protein FlgB
MFEGIFQSTTIPVMEQVVGFTEARQNVLAGNIANLDTPGYKARDLSVEDFQNRLKHAVEARKTGSAYRSPGEGPLPSSSSRNVNIASVAKDSKTITRHDGDNVGMEFQVSEMVKNQLQHNMALSIMVSQFRLLQAVISEKA